MISTMRNAICGWFRPSKPEPVALVPPVIVSIAVPDHGLEPLRDLLRRRLHVRQIPIELSATQPEKVLRWSRLLDRAMLLRVLMADDRAISRHLSNGERIRKVIPCAWDSIIDIEEARAAAQRRAMFASDDRGGGGGKRFKSSSMAAGSGQSVGMKR